MSTGSESSQRYGREGRTGCDRFLSLRRERAAHAFTATNPDHNSPQLTQEALCRFND